MIEVRNDNAFTYRDRYNGIDYEFPPGKTVPIDFEAARHFFGYGVADKMSTMVRNGWLSNSADMAQAKEILGNFIFRDADIYVPPVEAPGDDEQQPALLQDGDEGEGPDGLSLSDPPAARGRGRASAMKPR